MLLYFKTTSVDRSIQAYLQVKTDIMQYNDTCSVYSVIVRNVDQSWSHCCILSDDKNNIKYLSNFTYHFLLPVFTSGTRGAPRESQGDCPPDRNHCIHQLSDWSASPKSSNTRVIFLKSPESKILDFKVLPVHHLREENTWMRHCLEEERGRACGCI